MPDIDKEARTETATPHKREEARERGQVARSADLASALLTLAGLVFIRYYGPVMMDGMKGMFVETTRWMGDPGSYRDWNHQAWWLAVEMAKLLAPLGLFLLAIGLGANWLQFGFLMTAEPLTPNLDKINPINGARRLFSLRGVVLLVGGLLKIAVAGLVMWLCLRSEMPLILSLAGMPLAQAFSATCGLVFRAGLELAIIMLVLALFDYMYHRWQYEQDLKMTKEEVKEEMRRMEGDLAMRGRRRQWHRRMIIQHMMGQVPEADVVITNPTHLAIALQYDEDEMRAPVVLAKGERLIALRIRRIAAEHGVPIVENKPLAQAVYKAVDVGQQIPEHLYEAVAEVLALVYSVNARRPRRSA